MASQSRERVLEMIRCVDDGQGWSREERVLRHLGGGPAAVAVIEDLAATGEITRTLQTWSRLDDNFEPIGELQRVRLVRVTQPHLVPARAGTSRRSGGAA